MKVGKRHGSILGSFKCRFRRLGSGASLDVNASKPLPFLAKSGEVTNLAYRVKWEAMITVRNGNILVKVPRPAWAIAMYPYPKTDPRYRVLFRFYLNALPVSPEEEQKSEIDRFVESLVSR